MGGAFRQRAFPQLPGLLRRLQHQRSGHALHDGRAGRRPDAGRIHAQAYALGECKPGQEHAKTIEWTAKGVTPILYQVPADGHDHSALQDTLKAWAGTYRDGIFGKERIVVDYALARPSASTQQDNFVGRMLWALSHNRGCLRSASQNSIQFPRLDWLEAFSDTRYLHSDLNRFGVPPRTDVDEKLRFSLIRRPAPYRHAPWMALVSAGAGGSEWDDVMFQSGPLAGSAFE